MKVINFVIVFLILFPAFGQYTELWVIKSNGKVVSLPDSINLERYSNIQKGNTIHMNEDSRLQLLKVEGDECFPCAIHQQGTYNYKQLLKACTKEEKKLGTEHWKYVYENLLKHEEEVPYEGTIGGVYRAKHGVLPVHPLDNTVILDKTIHFIWTGSDKTKSYFFIIKEENADDLFTIEIIDTAFALHNIYSILTGGQKYLWTVQTKESDLDLQGISYFSFELPDRAWLTKFKEDFLIYNKSLLFSTAENEYLRGMFYEIHGVFEKALKCYQLAFELSDNDPFYLDNIDSFLSSRMME